MTKNNQPEISIIMPVYNGAKFLKEGLESVKNQTFKNWELIAVDDGSTDNSKEILDSLTADYETTSYLCLSRK